MHEPRLSVLIPVFNGERFLAECLESIMAQDFSDWEIVAIDDASTDASPHILQQYASRDPRIQWRRNPRNIGLGPNFNACLAAARSPFVKFILQDDKLLHPSALQCLLAALENHPSASLAASAAQLINADSQPMQCRDHFGRSGLHDGKQIIARCLKESCNLIGEPSLVLFRKCQATRGFNVRYRQLLDLELWFHLLEQGPLAYIPEPLCAFRLHPAQQTQINRQSGAADTEPLMIAEEYCCRPWVKETIDSTTIFLQMYNLRKRHGHNAAPLLARMMKIIGIGPYAACWTAYKLKRPIEHLGRWIRKSSRRRQSAACSLQAP